MDIIQELNMGIAEAEQKGKCARCGKDYIADQKRNRAFYWLNTYEGKHHNALYCENCGKIIVSEHPEWEVENVD